MPLKNREQRLQKLLKDLIGSATERLKLSEKDPQDKRENAEIDLIEDMDKASRVIDPEHDYYEGD